jgi:hypothetical protein
MFVRFQRINATCVEVDKTPVCLRLVAEMSDRFVERQINIKFCVTLGENASDTCALVSEAYGGEVMKKSSVFKWHKRFRESSHVVITNEGSALAFFDIKCIIHFEFISQGQTVNQAYYVEILKRLHEAVHRRRSELWPNDWILYHDNASTYRVLSVKLFLTQKIDY